MIIEEAFLRPTKNLNQNLKQIDIKTFKKWLSEKQNIYLINTDLCISVKELKEKSLSA